MTRPRILALLPVLAGTLAGQARVQHTFRFAVGEDTARVQTVVTNHPGPEILVRMKAHSSGWQPGVRAEPSPPGFTLHARAGRTALTVSVVKPGVWKVPSRGAEEVTLTYALPLTGRYLRNGLGQRKPISYPSPDQPNKTETKRYHEGLLLHPPATWLFIEGTQEVEFKIPKAFGVFGPNGTQFAAPDAETLAQTPIILGRAKTREVTVDDVRHEVVWSGFGLDRTDRDAWTAQFSKIIAAHRAALGPLPYSRYALLMGRRSNRDHASGWRRSTDLIASSLKPSQRLWINISKAHLASFRREYFRPAEWNDPEYGFLSPTAWFWLGWERYLANLTMVRAGIESEDLFWNRRITADLNILKLDTRHEASPVAVTGARMTSPRMNPMAPHPKVVGFLLALLLDVQIRSQTEGARGLQDAIQELAKNCQTDRRGYTNASIRHACEKIAGAPLPTLFERIKAGGSYPFPEILAKIGLRAGPMTKAAAGKKPGGKRRPQRRRRPPRWKIEVDPNASKAAHELRAKLIRG